MGIAIELASPMAIELSIISNFLLNHYWTFTGRATQTSFFNKLLRFHASAGIAGLINYAAFLTLLYVFNVFDILANSIGIGVGALFNYFLNSYWTWRHIETGPGDEQDRENYSEEISSSKLP
jgi:dolichol-phosphate mannosyltransferase